MLYSVCWKIHIFCHITAEFLQPRIHHNILYKSCIKNQWACIFIYRSNLICMESVYSPLGWFNTSTYQWNWWFSQLMFFCLELVQLFAYDTVRKQLTPKPGEQPIIPFPAAPIAGAVAGISSTLCTYPLELLKTRLTVQVSISLGWVIYCCCTIWLNISHFP